MRIVIATHGDFAQGIMSSLEMIIGKTEDIYYEAFQPYDSTDAFKERIEKHIMEAKGKDILVVCDMMGGTPYNVSALLSMQNKNVEVLFGINLPMLIEIALKKDSYTNKQMKEYINGNLLKTAGFFENSL